MNTGVQDAHNLAWKLAAVLQGTAGEQLLASYQSERRPVAEANTALSVANWNEAVKVPQALGLDPRAATLLNQVVNSGGWRDNRCGLVDCWVGVSAGRGARNACLSGQWGLQACMKQYVQCSGAHLTVGINTQACARATLLALPSISGSTNIFDSMHYNTTSLAAHDVCNTLLASQSHHLPLPAPQPRCPPHGPRRCWSRHCRWA
jgi:hypothetical protein